MRADILNGVLNENVILETPFPPVEGNGSTPYSEALAMPCIYNETYFDRENISLCHDYDPN